MKLKDKSIKISCDGGAATGKSTGARLISKKYRLKFLSSGLLYRYASYEILKNNPKNKITFLKKKFRKIDLNKINNKNLHTPLISEYSAKIAKISNVRNILKRVQIDFAKRNKNCCIEGRDISTKIIPNSDIKFFFKCNLNIAAYRRYKELRKKKIKISLKNVKKSLRIRNISDIKEKTPLYLNIEIR